jgi:hypothetical protein
MQPEMGRLCWNKLHHQQCERSARPAVGPAKGESNLTYEEAAANTCIVALVHVAGTRRGALTEAEDD